MISKRVILPNVIVTVLLTLSRTVLHSLSWFALKKARARYCSSSVSFCLSNLRMQFSYFKTGKTHGGEIRYHQKVAAVEQVVAWLVFVLRAWRTAHKPRSLARDQDINHNIGSKRGVQGGLQARQQDAAKKRALREVLPQCRCVKRRSPKITSTHPATRH